MRLEEKLLGEVLDFNDHQRVPLSSLERETRQGDYRYYGAQGVIDHIDAYIFDGQFILIAEDGANLVTRNEPIAFLVDGQFWVNNHAHVVKGKEGLADDYYIAALLNSLNIAGFVTGAAQPKLSQHNLKQIKISLPDYRAQREIADVLSAYDDLLENNRRRMGLLEEAARLLYREWFVHLRFPGHEHTPLINGVPEGWERKKLGDVLTLKRGYDLPERDRISGDLPIVSSSGITGFHNAKKADAPGVVTGRYGTLGEVYFIDREYWPLNTALYVSDFKGTPAHFIVHFLRHALQGIQSDKAAVPGLNRNVAHSLTVLWPSRAFRDQFAGFTRLTYRQLGVLNVTNEKLRAARDLLLPRLMSGEIGV